MSLVDAILEQVSGEALRTLARDVGRSENQARKATAAALPAVLASLSNQALDGQALQGLLRSLGDRPEAAGDATARVEEEGLSPAFGASLAELIDLLSRITGLDASGVRRLLKTLEPVVLGAIAARSRAEGGLDAGHLIHVFRAEKGKIAEALPEGLSLADLPSLPGVPTSVPAPADQGAGTSAWVLPALAVVLVAASLWILLKQPSEGPTVPASAAPSPATGEAGGPPSRNHSTPPPPKVERGATRRGS